MGQTRALIAVCVALLALAVVAGCGGGSSPTKTYSAGDAKGCLLASGLSVDPDGWDYVSHAARGGSYGVQVGANSVTLGFFGTSSDAKRAVGAYTAMGNAANVSMSDVVFQQGNVTLSWESAPSHDESQQISGCLR